MDQHSRHSHSAQRAYHKWFSPSLGRDMELLVFGHGGERVLVFPTRAGRFYDYEDWGLVGAAAGKIESGERQLFCVDSVDSESLYAEHIPPRERIERHSAYERYLMTEVLPLADHINPHSALAAHGCSLGAYHAVNIALRHPDRFHRAVALSGRYDLTTPMEPYRDLFDGYYDENIYFHNPSHFLVNMWDERVLSQLRRLNITLAVGEEDAFLPNNEHFARLLARSGIPHNLHRWPGEAHRARYWRQMVAEYL